MSVASPQAADSKKLDTMDESPENRSRSNSRSKSRSASRSKSRSRSRSPSKEKKRSRSRSASPRRRSRSRSRTYSPPRTDSNGRRVVSGRIHVSDFSSSLSKRELERAFEKYGKIVDLWMATYPPYYAFITYKHPEDAERAIRKMNEEYVSGNRVRVAHALPKRETRRFDSGRFGGFDRWGGGGGGPRRRYSRSPPRRSGRSRSRDRYQSNRRNRSRSRSSSR